jgi:hypothetical protein
MTNRTQRTSFLRAARAAALSTPRLAALSTALLAAAAACGGGGKHPAAVPSGGGDGGGGEAARPEAGGDAVVQPDTMDEIRRRFDRKRASVSRCLSVAIDAKELPRNSRGKITLNVVISPSGQAGEVKVVKTTLESPRLTECVIAKVKEIAFPEVPQPFPTSYTYAFEAM